MMKSKLKVISVVGARPQFVKLAPLAKELSKRFRHLIVHTGQHFDDNMSDIFFRQLRIPRPRVNLNVSGGTHGAMTGRMLARVEKVLLKEKPDLVLVYGDTNSTLAGALAAAKLSIPVGHIEAGMRSFVANMPEEINRKLTDHVCQILFCPTLTSIENLKVEGIKKHIVLSGDVMYELLDTFRRMIRTNRKALTRLGIKETRFLLLTVHRAATVDNEASLRQLVDCIKALPYTTLFPVHPRTRKRLKQFKLWSELKRLDHLIITEPLGYLDTLTAAFYARAVLTDSGGLQKEALFLGTPVLTLREETEWLETLKLGNRLVGLNKDTIVSVLGEKLTVKPIAYRVKNKKPSRIIVEEVTKLLLRRGR
jgi:UDP-N-acetylglucosamine 2-epimerase